MSPCFYGIDTPTKKELIASSHTTEEIRKYITADSLAYLSLDGMVKAAPGTPGQYCDACFTEQYPISFTRAERTPTRALEAPRPDTLCLPIHRIDTGLLVCLARLSGMSLVRKYRISIVATGVVVVGVRIASRLTSLMRLLGWLVCERSADPDECAMEDVAYYVDPMARTVSIQSEGKLFSTSLSAVFRPPCRPPCSIQMWCEGNNQRLEGHAWLVLDGRRFFEAVYTGNRSS